MQVKKTVRKKARIEIIPLIDVIMFLLATFVLFTLTMTKSKNIPLELPVGEAGVPDPDAIKPTKVSIDSSGDYFWNGERVTLDDLLIRLSALKSQADPKVLIDGEVGAQFGKAVVVIDEARRAGIFKVTIDTKAKQSVRTN